MAFNSHLLTQYISPLKDSSNIPAPGKKKSQLLVQQNNMEQDFKCEAKASFSELKLEVRRTENNTKFCCWGEKNGWIFILTFFWEKVKLLVAQSCPTLCDPMDCSLPHYSVHGILQARRLEQAAVPFSRGSSRIFPQLLFFSWHICNTPLYSVF